MFSLIKEIDPVFESWLSATPPVMQETDPVFSAWLAGYTSVNNADSAGHAGSAGHADSAGYAGSAGHADSAGSADTAGRADTAGSADYAYSAYSAYSAVYADTAYHAGSADYAATADYALAAGNAPANGGRADSAGYADSAGSAPAAGGNASSCDNFTGWFQSGNAGSSQGFNPNLPWFEIGNAHYINKTLVQNSGVFVNNGAEVLRGINQYSPIKTGETVVVGDYERVVVLDASSNNIAVSIPSSSGQGVGRVITLKRIDASENTVTITSLTTDGTIDGAVSIALVGQWSKVTLIAFGQGGLDWITI